MENKRKEEQALEIRQRFLQEISKRREKDPSASLDEIMESMDRDGCTEELRQGLKQEFMDRMNRPPVEPPDVQQIIAQLRKKTDAFETGELPTNLDRIEKMQYAYVMAVKYVSGMNVKVTLNENKPFGWRGCVEITGKNLEFKSPEHFAKLTALSSGTMITPLQKGEIHILFMF